MVQTIPQKTINLETMIHIITVQLFVISK
uniref:Uncharacterized protein n=1 Tax=Arundo donax TaxID=35708 RepID=A0A0A8ZGJ3_ARUDO